MPIIEAFGPTAENKFVPTATPGRSLSRAAREFGVLSMPSLEWNDDVARATAHLYERVKNSCHRSNGRSLPRM